MKKRKWIISVIILLAVAIPLWALEHVKVKVGDEKVSDTNPFPVKITQEGATAIQQDKVNVNPYTEVEKNYTNVKGIEIYNNGINIRVGFNDTTTADTDNYLLIPSTAVGYEKNNVNFTSLKVRLKGDTETDTGVARIVVYK